MLARTTGPRRAAVRPVLGAAEIMEAQALTREVHISDALMGWAARLVRATRPADSKVSAVREWVRWGAGPRAGQALVLAAKARALLAGRFSVTLDDLRAVAPPVLRHRVLVSYHAEAEGVGSDAVTERLLAELPEPRSPLG